MQALFTKEFLKQKNHTAKLRSNAGTTLSLPLDLCVRNIGMFFLQNQGVDSPKLQPNHKKHHFSLVFANRLKRCGCFILITVD